MIIVRAKREAWSYRLYASGYQPAHFSVYFDDQGVRLLPRSAAT
ncbi:hypothetical protein [Cupriavidus pinatubonensis]|nr:hypothetical protein [Cupriavidus pinatubonensis]